MKRLQTPSRFILGFFHTGAYQDQLAGYGGIKHCMIPSPKHVVVEYDKNGNLEDWLYAKEQSALSMLKILGYVGRFLDNKLVFVRLKNLPVREGSMMAIPELVIFNQ
jgi:arginine decarboxylase-like protein